MAMRWPEILMVLESDCETVVSKFHAKGRHRSALWQISVEMHDAGGQLCMGSCEAHVWQRHQPSDGASGGQQYCQRRVRGEPAFSPALLKTVNQNNVVHELARFANRSRGRVCFFFCLLPRVDCISLL